MSDDKDNYPPQPPSGEEQLDFGIDDYQQRSRNPLDDDFDQDDDPLFRESSSFDDEPIADPSAADNDAVELTAPSFSDDSHEDDWLQAINEPEQSAADTMLEEEADPLPEPVYERESSQVSIDDAYAPEEDFTDTLDTDQEEEIEEQDSLWPEPMASSLDQTSAEAEDDVFDDDEYAMDEEPADNRSGWPLGLIAAVVVGLILIGGGGYGVMQQRAALEEENRQLRATLANAVTQEDAADDRQARRELELRNAELQQAVNALQQENQRIRDTAAGLEQQMQAQVDAIKKAQAHIEAKAKTAATPPPKPAPTTTATADTSGWFVNFSSYSKRETADSWAAKLKPKNGSIAITEIKRGERTLYRVRVVGLADKASAQAIARELEKQYQLPPLWVGQQP